MTTRKCGKTKSSGIGGRGGRERERERERETERKREICARGGGGGGGEAESIKTVYVSLCSDQFCFMKARQYQDNLK